MNIGVIGCGRFGQNHVRVLGELGHRVFVYDANKDVQQEIIDKYKCQPIAGASDIEAVCVVTPSHTHYGIVKDYLGQGKHVFCEKPLCFESRDADKLNRVAEAKDVILAVGHIFRFTDGAQKFIDLYRIIKPDKIEMVFNNDRGPRADANIFFNLAIHHLDLLETIPIGKPKITYMLQENYGHIILKYHSTEVKIMVSYHSKKERKIILRNGVTVTEIDLMKNKGEPLKDELQHFVKCAERNVYPANHSDIGIIKILERLE